MVMLTVTHLVLPEGWVFLGVEAWLVCFPARAAGSSYTKLTD